jgi:Ca-activated chloride channel family protein
MLLSRSGFVPSLLGAITLFGAVPCLPEQRPATVSVLPREGSIGRPKATLRLDVHLTLVPVSVTDATDRPVNTLSRESFRLFEDGVEQKITSFSQEEGPISMGLLFDASGSMKNRIAASVEALKLVFQTTSPGDEFFLVQFQDRARLLSGFTPEPNDIHRELGIVEAKGWTALLDALALGANQMRSAKNRRRVLLVFSDGSDNNSRFSESEVRSMIVESDLRVYGVGIAHRPRLLQQLADQTGGKVMVAQNMSDLPSVVERLSREIRTQYLLGYSSSIAARDGKYHKIKVELLPLPGYPPLRVTWRRGFFAPEE